MRFLCQVVVGLAALLITACATTPLSDPSAAVAPDALDRFVWADIDEDDLDAALSDLAASLAREPDELPPYLVYDSPASDWSAPPSTTDAIAGDLVGHSDLAAMFSVQHPMIDQWIVYFTTRGREQYLRFYGRMQTYGPALRAWLRDEGVPEDLIWLSFIESGINPLAYSRAHAAGMWQFTSATGRRYDLRYDFWIDDRRDPERATRAAARHLRDLFNQFGSWELAFSAYNAGPRRVQRAIAYAGHDAYWRMVHQRHVLPRETRNYVPKLIAAQRIGADLKAYGFDDLAAPAPLTWQTLSIPGGVTLKSVAEAAGINEADLRILNLHLRRAMTPPGRDSYVNIPAPYVATTATWIAAGNLPISDWGGIHTVRSGDTLWEIARSYETSLDDLIALNSLRNGRIYPGQKLVVPTPNGSDTTTHAASDGTWTVRRGESLGLIARTTGVSVDQLKSLNALESDAIFVGQKLRLRADVRSGRMIEHRVRAGETLWKIAQRYGTSVQAIRNANGLRGSTIHTGQTLKIPVGPTS